MGFLHLSVLTDEELCALRKCVYEGSCDELIEMVKSEVLSEKHDVHRHFNEAVSRLYIEMKRVSGSDPLRFIDAFDVVETRLRSALFPFRPALEPKAKAVQNDSKKPDFSVLESKVIICPRCETKGVIKPVKRKKGYHIKILYYVYHRANKNRCYLKLSDRLELVNRVECELETREDQNLL